MTDHPSPFSGAIELVGLQEKEENVEIDETGVLDADSHTPCPNCGADLGYYTELIGETTCENCGQTFEIKHSEDLVWKRIK